jgi:hypothetical protein
MRKNQLVAVACMLFFSIQVFGNLTIGVIPDTQNMAEDDIEAEKIMKMLKFFVDKKDELNVVFVVSLGDMTQNNNVDSEWQRLKKAYDQLTEAGIPFAPCHGNHDGLQAINKWFPVSDFNDTPTWGGALDNNIENAYYKFSPEGLNFLLLLTQWKADQATTDWANGIFRDHPERPGIFAAHLIDQGTPYETDIITKNNNIFMSLSGHRGPPPEGREEYWTTQSPNGNTQHNVMTDYQGGKVYKDKGATIRYYPFKPAENKICAFTWNTTNEVFETDDNSEFCMDYDMKSVGSEKAAK